MSDAGNQWLIQQLQSQPHGKPELWVADENAIDNLPALKACGRGLRVISNRFDIAQSLREAGLQSQFTDFDFSPIADGSLSAVYYRVSKEKPVVHHVINQAYRTLCQGGQLFISGHKSEGTKTYWDKAKKLFGCDATLEKQGTLYSGVLTKHSNLPLTEVGLESKNYPALRPVAETQSLAGQSPEPIAISSKPGLFGWNKIDQGSAFLIEQLPTFLASLKQAPSSLLDLGCGYGYLTLMTKGIPLRERVATDNNAAALQAAEANFRANRLDVEVVADDCGQGIDSRFDMVLCNPPFHQGFNIDSRLTEKFLQQARNHLNPKGAALFVVNQFIPLERKASQYFDKVDVLADNRSFKLVRLAS